MLLENGVFRHLARGCEAKESTCSRRSVFFHQLERPSAPLAGKLVRPHSRPWHSLETGYRPICAKSLQSVPSCGQWLPGRHPSPKYGEPLSSGVVADVFGFSVRTTSGKANTSHLPQVQRQAEAAKPIVRIQGHGWILPPPVQKRGCPSGVVKDFKGFHELITKVKVERKSAGIGSYAPASLPLS